MILAAYYHPILATLFAFLAVILMGVILLQRGKGVGLSGAFGGAGGHTAFGAKTGDVLTWATIVIAASILTFAVVLNYIFVPLTPFEEATMSPVIPVPAAETQAPAETPAETTTPAESAPPSPESETPSETPPAGGGDTPTWSASLGIFGVEPD